MKFGQNIFLDKILNELKMCYVESKPSSRCQILEKPSVYSRGHIFGPILKTLVQNVCLDKISDDFENGSRGFKN